MNRLPVQSSNLRSVGYNETEKTLEIEFKNGTIYQYSSVPAAVYRGLMNAPSKGAYLHSDIRDQYSYSKIR